MSRFQRIVFYNVSSMTLNIAQHQKACLVQVNKDISSDFFVFFLLISRS